MKCKDCQYCESRGSYQYFFCTRDNSLIESNDYYLGKKMDCTVNKIEDDEWTTEYVIWNRIRK
jgi:hypothetical protein